MFFCVDLCIEYEESVKFITLDYFSHFNDLAPPNHIIQKTGLMNADGTIIEYPKNLHDG